MLKEADLLARGQAFDVSACKYESDVIPVFNPLSHTQNGDCHSHVIELHELLNGHAPSAADP